MPSTKELLDRVEDRLRKNMDSILEDWEPKIKKGVAADLGVADLKEKVAKASEDNAKAVDEIRDLSEKLKAEKAEAEEALAEQEARMNELERMLKQRGPGGGPSREVLAKHTAGGALARKLKERFTELQERGGNIGNSFRGRVEVTLPSWEVHEKASAQMQKDVTITGDNVIEPQYRPGILRPAERQLTIRNLMPSIPTSSNTVYFVSESSTTDNAGMQSSLGAAKGETDMELDVDSETIQTIAHFVQVPTQLLDDITGLEGYVNSRMSFLLNQKEEQQLLYGTGTGVELNGLMTQATAYDTTLEDELMPSGEAVTDIDKLRLAIAQAQVALYPPDGLIIHPYNWAGIELLKDGNDRYIFAAPQDAAGPRMWGLGVVATNALNSGDFLVGAFSIGAAIWDRMAAQVAISTEDSDNFQKNLATIRAEKRMTLTVYRTDAFVEGDLDLVVT